MSPRTAALRAVVFAALLAGVLGAAAPALAADTPFSQRYAHTTRGNIDAVGNQLLTCPTAAAGCVDARNRTGAAATMNNNYNMGYVDVDADATTVNSSTATLSLPAGATVLWAGLYWGADTAAGTGGSAAPNAAARGTVRFKVASGSYQAVTAAPADLLTSTGRPTRYRAFADVTALLPASGNATYTVADVQAGRGDDRFAGWTLVVAYEDATQEVRRLNVYDGLGTVDAPNPSYATNIAPFFTPSSGTVDTRIGLLAFEGDAGLATESMTFNGNSLTDVMNPLANPMNSTMTVDGTQFAAKTPNYSNLQGTDIDVFNRTGLLAHNQSSATLAFTSSQDLFIPSALWLVSDEGPAVNSAGPSIGGIARDGSTLTANPGTWNGTPTITYEYQWRRCDAAGDNCQDIAGETGSTYTLGPADVGSTIRVVVTAVNDAGSSAPATSPPTSTVTQLPPANVTVPVVSGTLLDGETLTTTLGGWTGTAPLDYDVQWQRCDAAGDNCQDIAGETAWSYVLTGADVGSTIRSEVTAANDAGSAIAVSVPSTEVDPAPPVNTVAPAVSGVARDGQTLSADDGSWTGTAPLGYDHQWQRCDADGNNCADIAGATGTTYVLTGDDIGNAVRVQVTASNVAGDDTASSSPTSAVIADPPANAVAPALSGSATDGGTLTLDDGDWTGTGPLDYDYVWQRCDAAGDNCVAIAGETGTSYTLTSADVGFTIRAVVTASNGVGVAAEQTAPTAVVDAEAPSNTVVPVVTGDWVDGGTLTSDTGTWDGTQPLLYTYQWQRCDEIGNNCNNVFGATGETYTLTGDDIDMVVRVVVAASNSAGSSAAASIITAPVEPMPPANVDVPWIAGTPSSGQFLIGHDGTWVGSHPLDATYQWQRCDTAGNGCADIAGATNVNYQLTDDDAGSTLRLEVTYTNAAGSDTAVSEPSATVAGAPPANVVDPSLSGTFRDGEMITLDDGDWTGTPALVPAYQWQRCDAGGGACADIAGETGVTYVLQSADVDATVRAVVTYTNDSGQASEATAASAVVVAAPPVLTIEPSVVGTAVDGETVTADPGVWAGTTPLDFTYQWLRCDVDGTNCVAIAGAGDDEYTLTGDDAGHGIRVEVTATNSAGTATGTSPVAAVNAAAPENTVLPVVTGERVDGATLTADDGSWDGTAPLAYDHQWLRCNADGTNCVAIAGETGTSYTLTPDDIGHDVRVSVTAANAAGSAQATSAPSGGGVEVRPPLSVSPPAVSGVVEDGSTLTAANGGWTGTLPIGFTYQWLRCDTGGGSCSEIGGATQDTYTLTSDDVGGTVRVEVRGTNSAGDDIGTSAPSATVAAAPPVSTGLPAVAGSPVDQQTLTAGTGSFSGTGPFAYDYQWQRCDPDGTNCVDVGGATDSTYDLTAADVGAAMRVVVTATNGAGSDSATSPATAEVQALPPVNTTAPTISGVPVDGETLTADPGTWTGTAPIDYGYQWQRCDADGTNCADIIGADLPTYTLVPGDVDHVIRVEVTATNAGGSAASESAPTALAEPAPPVNTAVPAVSGTFEDGETLTATTGTWTGTEAIDYAYQWIRCELDGSGCEDIGGATASTYDLTAADVGRRIVVEVTASNAAGQATAASVPSTGVGIDPPANTGTPEAQGTPVDGETLTADPGTWTGTGPIDYTYQWERCDAAGDNCVDIVGATEGTYTLGTDDIGSTVRVEVTADNGDQTTVASPAVGPVTAAPPVSLTVPTVSGTAAEGETLSAGDGTWDGSGPLTFDHQWQRCDADGTDCVDIAGATGDEYTLTGDDVGHAIVVVVTASNAAGDASAVSAPTAETLPAPPVNTTQPPAPSGTPIDGGTLTADPGTWTGDEPIDYDYQWQRCDAAGTNCEDIDGATGETYTPTGGDAGHAIVVVVTATNPGGSSSEASAPTTPVAAAPPVNTTAPSITGTPADGETLTAEPGTWTGTTPIAYEYQWQRCAADGTSCVDIDGATDATYTPGASDIGSAITVVVTAVNDGGDASETAAASAPVVASAPEDTVAPAITGDVALGEELTADTGSWTGTAPVTFAYQWQRCDEDGANCVDIGGATDDTYTLTEQDQGHTVVVVVTATNAAGSDTAASEPSAVLPIPPANVSAPSISGRDEVGDVLTADPGEWSGTGPLDYEYQWVRCDFYGENCVEIAGATGETYTLTSDDVGSTIQVVVTASNAAGSAQAAAPTTPAVTEPQPDPEPTPTPTPTPAPGDGSGGGAGSGSGSGGSGGSGGGGGGGGLVPGGDDLGSVPGSLVGDASCQQLAGNSKYSRVKAKGIGTIRVRAYATGPATNVSPVLVTTQISGGKAKKVTYKLDGRSLKAKRGKTWKAAITPSRLQNVGIHVLKATIKGRKKGSKAKVVTLKLKTVPCKTLFTAQRWKTTAGYGLRLRIDARTAMSGIGFKVARPLLPRAVKKPRTIGFMRVFVAGESGRRRYSLTLPKKGPDKRLVSGAGKPLVKLAGGGITVAGLPARAAVVELTLYRVKKLDGATKRRVYKLRARVAPAGGSLSARPKAPR